MEVRVSTSLMIDYSFSCRHAVFSHYFGDKPPNCKGQCDYCKNPKDTESKIQAFFSSDLSKIPGLDLDDDQDLYGGGRRGQAKYCLLFWVALCRIIRITLIPLR